MAPPSETSALIAVSGCKLLLVDDDRINLRILRGILLGEGYVLKEADCAESALETYTSFQPDLVLFDVMLPGMNGFEACRELRRRHGVNAAPVIFITAKQESEDIIEGFSAGGVDYIFKPFRQKEVIARIRTHLQNRLLVAQLSNANAAKNKLVGMAAHDLRNPLASIRGIAEFMLDGTVGPMSADQLELIGMIHQASQGMVTLVNDLLDTATIEAGELKIEPAEVNLADIIEKSVAFNALESSRKGTQIHFTPPAGPLPPIVLDASKIRQVVDNLISNAVKYSPPGSAISVSLQACSAGGQSIGVLDQGPGIPEDERDKLFKDFGRLSARPTGGEKSTGLGLAICRKIVEAHHGSIVAENRAVGCEFRVTLPPSPL